MKVSDRTIGLPLSVRSIAAMGSLGLTASAAAISFHLLFFFTDVIGVSAGTLASALLVGRVWDMLNDPLAGWLSDRTTCRWGRRRIYLFLSALPLGLASVLLWSVPSGLSLTGQFWWIVFAYFLFDTFFTFGSVPFTSLVTSLSDDYDQRMLLAAWAAAGAWGGYVIGSTGMPFLVGLFAESRTGFTVAGSLLGALAAAGLLAGGIGLKESPSMPIQEGPGWRFLWSPLKSPPFRRLLAAAGFARLAFTILMAGLPYFITHWMNEPKLVAAVTGTTLVVVGLFLPAWRKLATRWEKGTVYAGGLAVAGVAMVLTWWVPAGRSFWVWGLTCLAAVGLGAQWVLPMAMVPDTIDWDHSRSGVRRDGAHFGLFGAADKMARTLGIVGLGWGLAAVGYAGGTPSAQALTGFRLLFGPVTGALLLFSAGLLLGYPLTREKQADLRRQIDHP